MSPQGAKLVLIRSKGPQEMAIEPQIHAVKRE
jgi:hypothetical protein